MKISDIKSERRFDDSMLSLSSSKNDGVNMNSKTGVKIYLALRGRGIECSHPI